MLSVVPQYDNNRKKTQKNNEKQHAPSDSLFIL